MLYQTIKMKAMIHIYRRKLRTKSSLLKYLLDRTTYLILAFHIHNQYSMHFHLAIVNNKTIKINALLYHPIREFCDAIIFSHTAISSLPWTRYSGLIL